MFRKQNYLTINILFTLFGIFLYSKYSFAESNIKIDLTLLVNNDTIQESTVITKDGEQAIVSQLFDHNTGSYIKVLPKIDLKSDSNKKITVEYDIGEINNKQQHNWFKPIIIAEPDKPAEVSMIDEHNNSITLKATTSIHTS